MLGRRPGWTTGNGVMSYSNTPVAVSGISTATAVSAMYNDSCALLSGGTIQCWGFNEDGELGNQHRDSTPVGVQAP